MDNRSPAVRSAFLVCSFAVYFVAIPILLRFVDSSGLFGVVYVLPLCAATWSWGWKGGIAAAAGGVILNQTAVLLIGSSGVEPMGGAPMSLGRLIFGHIMEIVVFTLVVLVTHLATRTRGSMSEIKRESERSRRLLLLSETRYQDLVEAAPLGIAIVENGIVTFANPKLEEITGYSREELLGAPFLGFVHPDDARSASSRYAQAAAGTRFANSNTVRVVRKDGSERWIEATGRQILWDNRPAVLMFIADVNERRQVEEALAQSQKMEAIGLLAGGIAHDFNNLLQVILGYSDFAIRKLEDRETVRRTVSIIHESAARAASLTQQLLAFSRKQVVMPRPVELGRLVLFSEQMLDRVLGEDVSLTVDIGESESVVSADEGQLQQVIMNLAVNARDAMPSGGRLSITLRNVTVAAGAPRIPPGRYARLSVADTGHGMDEATRSRVFEPFFTTKEFGKGTGLGLSTVYGIVTQAGGTIEVESRPGHGAVFTIHLPLVDAPASEQPKDGPASRRGSETVLVVEDEDSVRGLIRTILENGGYTVLCASNGEEAVALCRTERPRIDLLLSDLVMPGIQGDMVAREIRDLVPGIKIIFMTGYADKAPELPAIDQQASDVLVKPFTALKLLAAVRRSLDTEPRVPA